MHTRKDARLSLYSLGLHCAEGNDGLRNLDKCLVTRYYTLLTRLTCFVTVDRGNVETCVIIARYQRSSLHVPAYRIADPYNFFAIVCID